MKQGAHIHHRGRRGKQRGRVHVDPSTNRMGFRSGSKLYIYKVNSNHEKLFRGSNYIWPWLPPSGSNGALVRNGSHQLSPSNPVETIQLVLTPCHVVVRELWLWSSLSPLIKLTITPQEPFEPNKMRPQEAPELPLVPTIDWQNPTWESPVTAQLLDSFASASVVACYTYGLFAIHCSGKSASGLTLAAKTFSFFLFLELAFESVGFENSPVVPVHHSFICNTPLIQATPSNAST